MKSTLIITLMLSMFSCNAQKEKINIEGNWFNESYTAAQATNYVETFINDKEIYSYDERTALGHTYSYVQESSIIYVMIDAKKTKLAKVKYIDENTISFNNEDDTIILKRIIDDEMTLETFLYNTTPSNANRNKQEDAYWLAFNKRKSAWEKANKINSSTD